MIHLVLYEPEIPPNTGNLIRLAANTGFFLHLIEPLGFNLSDKQLRRAGMDYSQKAFFKTYSSLDVFLGEVKPPRIFAVTTKGKTVYSDLNYEKNDVFLFGPETRGLPQNLLDDYPMITLPMTSTSRSLNLANAVSIVAYEAWRQINFEGSTQIP